MNNSCTIDESNTLDNVLFDNLKKCIVETFNAILLNANVKQLEFNDIEKILDEFVSKIYVLKDKSSTNYDKGKKRFGKFLTYNYKFIVENLSVESSVLELFSDNTSENWNLLHVLIVSYLSYKKHINHDKSINFRGMIEKLMETIEQFNLEQNELTLNECDDDENNKCNDDENNENDEYDENMTDADLLNCLHNKITNFDNHCSSLDPEILSNIMQNQGQSTENSNVVMNNLLGDIKSMFTNQNNLDAKYIFDVSKNLSEKYQNMIENGSVNLNDLMSGVINMLNNPEMITEQFNDIDESALPDPNSVLSEMSNDPNLKEAMNMMGGFDGKKPLDVLNLMSGLINSSMGGVDSQDEQSTPQTMDELNSEIERMMKEVEDAENN